MITEGEAAIPLETTVHAFRNQEKKIQRSTIVAFVNSKIKQMVSWGPWGSLYQSLSKIDRI